MLNKNIQRARKAKGLSQEELACQINVVRQTISKWEKGLSVPDADMLIALAAALDASVSTLLGDTSSLSGNASTEARQCSVDAPDAQQLAEKLELINAKFAEQAKEKRKLRFRLCLAALLMTGVLLIAFRVIEGVYEPWDYSKFDFERAVVGVLAHGFGWIFVRLSPFIAIGALIGMYRNQER